MQELVYGTLPDYTDFIKAFNIRAKYDGSFQLKLQLRGMKFFETVYNPNGDMDMNKERLWDQLNQCALRWSKIPELGDFAFEVLQILGFKWVK